MEMLLYRHIKLDFNCTKSVHPYIGCTFAFNLKIFGGQPVKNRAKRGFGHWPVNLEVAPGRTATPAQLPLRTTPTQQGFSRDPRPTACVSVTRVPSPVGSGGARKSRVLCRGFEDICSPQGNGACGHPSPPRALAAVGQGSPRTSSRPSGSAALPAHCSRPSSSSSWLVPTPSPVPGSLTFSLFPLSSTPQPVHHVQPVPVFSPPSPSDTQQLPPCSSPQFVSWESRTGFFPLLVPQLSCGHFDQFP